MWFLVSIIVAFLYVMLFNFLLPDYILCFGDMLDESVPLAVSVMFCT